MASNGAVGFVTRHRLGALEIEPVQILSGAGARLNVTGAHWSVRRSGSSWWLELRLDDRTLPLPYVIDPSVTVRGANTGVDTGASTTFTINAGNNIVQEIFRRKAAAGEPGSYTVTLGSAQKAAGGIVGYVGVDTSGGTGVDQVNGAAGASSTSVSAPSVTPSAATDTVTAFWSTANGTTLTADGSTTPRWQSISSGGTGGASVRVTVAAGDFTAGAANVATAAKTGTGGTAAASAIAFRESLRNLMSSARSLDFGFAFSIFSMNLSSSAGLPIRASPPCWACANCSRPKRRCAPP